MSSISTDEKQDTNHKLYETADADAPDVIKDSNGEVVLGLCRNCGRGEIELEEPCDYARRPGFAFDYTNYKGETSIRKAVPLEVFLGETEWHPGQQWLLRAFDLDKKTERVFAMCDMNSLALREENTHLKMEVGRRFTVEEMNKIVERKVAERVRALT